MKRAMTAALFMVLSASPVVSESLSDALAKAYRNSGLIEQNRAVLRAADEDVAQAVAALRPVLNYAANINRVELDQGGATSQTFALGAEWLLYDFGRSRLSIDIAKETVLATRSALLDVENAVLFNAVDAYLGVRRAEVFVDLNENNVRLLSQQLRATEDRFEVGEVTRTDVSLAEARLAAARSGLAAELGGLELAREQYRVAIGDYPGQLAALPSLPNIPGTEESARDVARRENPSILQVQHQVAAAELGVENARRGIYPRLIGDARYEIGNDGFDSTSLGVTLSGPIYQGGAIASGLRQAQAFRDEIRAQLYTTGLLVDQEIGNAYATLAVSVARIEASESEVAAANLALDGVREEFQLGARTTLDVLDQEQEALDAQTRLVTAIFDRQIAVYGVLDAMGNLTAQRLGLNVPIYDPAAYYNAVRTAPTTNVSPQGARLDKVFRSIGKQ